MSEYFILCDSSVIRYKIIKHLSKSNHITNKMRTGSLSSGVECHGVDSEHLHHGPSTWLCCFYWFSAAGLSCLLSSCLVASAAAVPEDPVSAAGTQSGSVLWRVSAKRQPDWKCDSGCDLSGKESLTPSVFPLNSARMWEFFFSVWYWGWRVWCCFVSGAQ